MYILVSADIIFAGLPAILQLPFINDLFTTEFAPIIVLSPIHIFPKIFAPGPIQTLLPIIGTDPSSTFVPIFTP